MKLNRQWMGVLCASAVFAVAGCKKEEPAPAPEPEEQPEMTELPPEDAEAATEPVALDVEPCELVEKERLSELAGIPLADGKVVEKGNGVARCTWDRPAGDPMPGISIAVQAGDVEQIWQNHTVMPGGQEVKDLGDKAVWQDTVKQLHVVKGDRVLSIAHPAKDGRMAAEKVAREVLPKL